MKRKFITAHIALIAALIVCSVAYTNGQKIKVALKFISFNIRQSGLPGQDGNNKWDNRKGATIKLIEQEAPAVFGLQEALLEQVRYIEKNLPQYTRFGVGRDDGENAGEFMAVFYLSDEFNLLRSGTFWLSETPDSVSKGWDAGCFRTVTWVLLQDKKSKKEFYYFNTHFDNQGAAARENSAKLVAKRIKDITTKKASIILGGDFNSSMSDPIFNPLKKYMNVVRECSPVTDNKGTFNGFGSTPNNIVLDHFFCKNVTCKLFKTLDGNYGAPYISDHYPIEFVCELK